MYVISKTLIKSNTGGPYKHRYDTVKEKCRETHTEWFKCKCLGTGKTAKGTRCSSCKGVGEVKMHAHLHGMLLMTKLLLKNLWIEWTDGGTDCVDEPSQPWEG